MKVHLISNSYSLQSGGAEKLVRQLHRGLLDKGVDSRLVGLAKQVDYEDHKASCLQLPSAYHPLAFFRLCAYMRREVDSGDIIHGHLFPTIFYIALMKRLGIIRTPLVMTEHNTHNRRRRFVLGKWLDSRMYQQFDRIIAISRGVSTALLKWLPSLSEQISVVYNGAELAQPEPLDRKTRSRPVIISVSTLRRRKNYPAMLAAVASLQDIDFEYWIVGDGKQRTALEKLARELGISDKTHFLGSVYPATELLEQADIFLMASTIEGFGLAAVEAMNASLPLVISDIPGLAELDDGNPPCSIRVNPQSNASIASALKALLLSAATRRDLGHAAFARAQSFSLDAMVESYLNEYDACRKLP